jgi:ATP-dependent DNA helicase RecG
MDEMMLRQVITTGETLIQEFKSDRKQLSDAVIYEEVVALTNTNGGMLFLGVEDDGQITGCHPRHGEATDPAKLVAAIGNNTRPAVVVEVEVIPCQSSPVVVITVPVSREPCATASGKALRRVIQADGKPASVPFLPSEQRSRRTDLGLLDFSAQVMPGACWEDLDPLAFAAARRLMNRPGADKVLLDLSDREMAKAMRVVESQGETLAPTIAGLLLFGRQEAIERWVPTHACHVQALGSGGAVTMNDGFRLPLVHLIGEIESRLKARNDEQEVAYGFLRLGIPRYDADGVREAVLNALLHRDYSRLNACYIQFHPDHLLITSPGGFPAGITLANLLVHEPTPRNPRLVDACKRLGLVEQTGRGIDRIYLGLLRFGRGLPDYSRSDDTGVRVLIPANPASPGFAAFVHERTQAGKALGLDELMVLNALMGERRLEVGEAAELMQQSLAIAKSLLERMVEQGLVEATGERPRVYHLSAPVYRRLANPEGYVRAHGIDRLRWEGLVMEWAVNHGRVARADVITLLRVTPDQAYKILERMCTKGKLVRQGKGRRGSYYTPGPASPEAAG